MIKCTDRLPTWENIDDLILIKIVEVDDVLMPVENGKVLITTCKLEYGWHDNNKIYFDLVKVFGDGDYEFLAKDIEAPEGNSDLYFTIKSGYRGWLSDRRRHTDFMIESWLPLHEAIERLGENDGSI